ncbi:hypothetical protein DYU05_07440 [Mucilaginibacter terrenus]|uniref:TonB C-terminal domain-containing protein n=2 Tax=Mucilaginibacter terrenus TaxID=2482727 RepID=A0A3E2NWQ7_9SPHI|nr:hypothetical protein DYU05_07440 [Mucilaginibacter terrenus]
MLVLLLNAASGHAQELTQRKNRLTDSVTEVYQTYKENKNIMHGLYQALYKKSTPVASGMYNKNVRVGIWRFFDSKGRLIETYDYDNKELKFEGREDITSALRYFVDRDLDSTAKVTKPIKIGGRYYGYIPYLRLFTLPRDLSDINKNIFSAVVELLVSPYGRLADYKVHLVAPNFERVINMNTHLPDPADMVFTPATLNGEGISCRIMIKAYITDDGHLDFDNE